jgi:YebC/PmpR family DNA-binding regulatory protein
MSGHSKWSKIKRQKGANDNKRSAVFTKLIKEIQVAAKLGSPDPDGNARLYAAIQSAKANNMPKENIDRAIKKASGADATNYTEITYEALTLHKVALIIECTTDNTNRSVSNVRNILSKFSAQIVPPGTHEFIFSQKGVITFLKPAMNPEELELELIDGGAEDIEIDEGHITVFTAREDFGPMQKKLKELKIEIESAQLQRIAKIHKKLEKDDALKVMRMIDMLEDDDDVQNIYHNLELTEELMGHYEN